MKIKLPSPSKTRNTPQLMPFVVSVDWVHAKINKGTEVKLAAFASRRICAVRNADAAELVPAECRENVTFAKTLQKHQQLEITARRKGYSLVSFTVQKSEGGITKELEGFRKTLGELKCGVRARIAFKLEHSMAINGVSPPESPWGCVPVTLRFEHGGVPIMWGRGIRGRLIRG
ncbi:hypothetical protein V8E53_002860 [Lactarius tabidus]